MTARFRTQQQVQFGDFQTPPTLAAEVCRLVAEQMPSPTTVVEPTCGRGAFLVAALESFPSLRRALGFEIDPSHVAAARIAIEQQTRAAACEVRQHDFFHADWNAILGELPEPLLVLGNPPWVTSAALGTLQGSNLPKKSNFQGYAGLDALTGKSNFDISEWMLIHLLETLRGRQAILAMLCKAAAARKVLLYAWNHALISRAEVRSIDAQRHFGAAVEGCLLVCRLFGSSLETQADVYPDLRADRPSYTISLRDGRIVANQAAYEETRHLAGGGPLQWRSGIKHDCARVMEFRRIGTRFQNSLGELLELEDEYLYPLLKSSDIAAGRVESPKRWMLVTQRTVGDDTRLIKHRAPKTWQYLQRHADRLDRRASSIYRGRPPFSIFGVGEYTFSHYKVAVSGLYKQLSFTQVRPLHGKPVVLDDTCAFLACRSETEAAFVAALLSSPLAQAFYEARIFWDAKRPITSDILNQLDLLALARTLEPTHPIAAEWAAQVTGRQCAQMNLF